MPENFFDFQQRMAERRATGKATATTSSEPTESLTVTQLTSIIDKAIKTGVPASLTVKGEVSNVSDRQSSGHLYFTMKDSGACINCVMWRDNAARLQFRLEDGMEIVATGRVTVYAPQGRYQFTVQRLQPAGRGALEVAFRQLQAKLSAEGLFSPERKKPIPPYPSRIVMVTSRATAALQDMLKVLKKFPWLTLMVYHVPVQGDGSATKIAEALNHLSQRSQDIGGVDVILLGRGGGSLEDLWSFNEEIVARAVASSRIPIVTGIGHEVDCSISDLVADYHAHTPTEAAQVISKNWQHAADAVALGETRLRRQVKQLALNFRNRLDTVIRHEFFRRPMDRIQLLRQLLDDRQKSMGLALTVRINRSRDRLTNLDPRLPAAIKNYLQTRTAKLEAFDRHLQALSPHAVLNRGYTITTLKKTGEILKSAASLKPGDRLQTRFADGETESIVQDSRQLQMFE